MELFIFQDLTFSYPGQTHAALDGLRFEIPAGQFLVIAGPSGCGSPPSCGSSSPPSLPMLNLTGSFCSVEPLWNR